ncbi:MAG: vWA domain-containing protein [Christensenellales bacterium]|jgi:uncharacterized protein YegL
MKKGLTELVMILDKSGSMAGLEGDTIGGYNAMLEKQRKIEGECHITTVLFDNDITLLHDRTNLKAVSPITQKEYQVGGCTALLDAIGLSIQKIGNAQKHTAEEYQAEKVIFVIITDGAENASRVFSPDKVKKMIKKQKERYQWEFIFLGANIDAVETASHFGIAADRAQNFHADSQGIEVNFSAMSAAVSAFRQANSVPDDWNKDIKLDYQRRGRNR